MTYDAFLNELGKAGLSVRAFADLIGMNPNSVSNYSKAGEVPRHLACIVVLIAEMNAHGVAYQPAIKKACMGPKKRPRGSAQPGRFGGDRQEWLDLGSSNG